MFVNKLSIVEHFKQRKKCYLKFTSLIIFCAVVIVEIITKIQKKFTAIMNSLIS